MHDRGGERRPEAPAAGAKAQGAGLSTATGGRPEGMRRHEEPAYGYAVSVPAVFVVLLNSVDPLARMLRRLDDKDLEEESKLTGSWPVGFADPEVVGDLGEAHSEPLRLLEFDVLGRPDPMSAAELAAMRDAVRDALPAELAARGLPGFAFLGVRELKLGPLDALAFEYEWDGPADDPALRDRGLVVWAPTPAAVYHVYYHCPPEVWGAWWPEVERILASFELIERREPMPREAEPEEAEPRRPSDAGGSA